MKKPMKLDAAKGNGSKHTHFRPMEASFSTESLGANSPI